MESLSKSIRRVGLRINLVDTGDLVLSILTNEGLVDTEMLGRGMIDLFGALLMHPLVVSVDNSRVNLSCPQLIKKNSNPNHITKTG
jgi:hypothetical protein